MTAHLHEPVLAWYAEHQRDLPWRADDRTPWGVLVSEIMLQQTPVSRVLPVWTEWVHRWPTPNDFAAASPADVIRAWGRLGYPRRALRLHATAAAIVDNHGGEVPDDVDVLRTLPGVGEYTAAAVAAFAFGRRHAVLDTNVRRVIARSVGGRERAGASTTAHERTTAERLLPVDATAATWSVALMELGALVCTARSPSCDSCPITDACAWARAGQPADDSPPPQAQAWHGTDRQARGRLMATFRDTHEPLERDALTSLWSEAEQRNRALTSLIADGLLEVRPDGRIALPGNRPQPDHEGTLDP